VCCVHLATYLPRRLSPPEPASHPDVGQGHHGQRDRVLQGHGQDAVGLWEPRGDHGLVYQILHFIFRLTSECNVTGLCVGFTCPTWDPDNSLAPTLFGGAGGGGSTCFKPYTGALSRVLMPLDMHYGIYVSLSTCCVSCTLASCGVRTWSGSLAGPCALIQLIRLCVGFIGFRWLTW
jgi:hypothetical protein